MMNILSVRGWMFIVEALRCDEHPFSTWLDVVEALRSMNIQPVRGCVL